MKVEAVLYSGSTEESTENKHGPQDLGGFPSVFYNGEVQLCCRNGCMGTGNVCFLKIMLAEY